jgi:hypothetical protein
VEEGEYLKSMVILVNRTQGVYVPVYREVSGTPEFLDIVPEGSLLPVLGVNGPMVRVRLPDGNPGLVAVADTRRPGSVGDPEFRRLFVEHARKQLGRSYLSGGNAPAGFDGSGLVMLAARIAGRILPRQGAAQYAALEGVERAALRPGDLVFFTAGGGGGASHVAIWLEGGQLLHAYGTDVTVSRIESPEFERSVIGFRQAALRPRIEEKPVVERDRDPVRPSSGEKPTVELARSFEAPLYTIHLESNLQTATAIRTLDALGARTALMPLAVPVFRDGQTFLSISTGLFTEQPRAVAARRRLVDRKLLSAASRVRRIPGEGEGRPAAVYTVRLMALQNPRFAVEQLLKHAAYGLPVWVRRETGARGAVWYMLYAGAFSEAGRAETYLRELAVMARETPVLRQLVADR